jgi:hypothetical protein
VAADCAEMMNADFSRLVDGTFETGQVTGVFSTMAGDLQASATQRGWPAADSSEISEANISFLLCQVKTRADEANDLLLSPVYCGIVESGELCMQPYLAIRHELSMESSSGATVEGMKEETGRVGLVLCNLTCATSPCLKFQRRDLDPLTEDLLERVLTVCSPSIKLAEDYSDRLVLAYGALPCQIKQRQYLDQDPVEAPPPPLKKKR